MHSRTHRCAGRPYRSRVKGKLLAQRRASPSIRSESRWADVDTTEIARDAAQLALEPARLLDLRHLARDPLHQPVEAGELRVDDRLAGGDQPGGNPALGIGPAHDVDQTEMPEGEVGVAPE